MIWVGVTLLVFALTAAISGGVLFLIFLRSGDGTWRRKVLNLHSAGLSFYHDRGRELAELDEHEKIEMRRCQERAWQTYLRSVSVSELGNYPGIGPATVERLRGAGLDTLAHLQRASIRVHGLGQKRLADVGSAVRTLTRQVSSRFESGACREAQELTGQINELRLRTNQPKSQLIVQQAGAKEFLTRLVPFVEAATRISFWNYLRTPRDSAVPPELLETDFPDLEACVRQAEGS